MSRPSSAEPGRLRVAGVVPAAGASARMGTPKALLDAGGRSFVAAVVGALVGGGCHPVVVVTSRGQSEVRRRAEGAGALVLENPDPGEGPITSIRLALAALGQDVDGVALLPVDHPAVRAETVAALLEALDAAGGPLVLPTSGGHRGHPAIFHRRLFPELLDPGLEGGARTVVHRHIQEARIVDVDDPGVLADIDTPDAYRAVFGAVREP